jgi:hypothetical protein
MPASAGVMRPSGDTAAASATTRAAPPRARPARWAKCQSLIRPSSAEYWHMGETMMRFLRVTSFSVKESKRAGIVLIFRLLFGCSKIIEQAVDGTPERGRKG